WKIIRLGLTLLAHQSGLGVALVHVVGDGAEVVEELAVDGPALVALPDRRPDQLDPFGRDGVAQREGALAVHDDVAEALVRRRPFVGRRRGGREPALVDTAPVR